MNKNKLGRFVSGFIFLSYLFVSTQTWAISVSPSPSYAGNYTVSWNNPTGSSTYLGVSKRTKLQAKVGSGSWYTVSTPSGST